MRIKIAHTSGEAFEVNNVESVTFDKDSVAVQYEGSPPGADGSLYHVSPKHVKVMEEIDVGEPI